MTHIYFCITVLLTIGIFYLLTHSPAVGLMFSLLTFAFVSTHDILRHVPKQRQVTLDQGFA